MELWQHISGPVDFSKPTDKTNVKGKTALVTGGASGIGAGVSRAFANAGAIVTIVDSNAEAGAKFVSELVDAGLRSVTMKESSTEISLPHYIPQGQIRKSGRHRLEINGRSIQTVHPELSQPDS